MNILVTGSAGFIGSNFVNYMAQAHPEWNFFSIDKLDYCSNVENIKPALNHHFYKCDLNDRNFVEYILENNCITHVVHFAAQSHVDNSFDNSLQYTEDNIKGTHTLLDCCKSRVKDGKIKKFIHMSTDEVYGETRNDTFSEYSILNPTNPYAATKAAAEMLVNSYHHSYKIPSIIIRANNVYGPNQYPEKLIPKFIQHLLENKRMTIHGTGETRRNFLHVEDLIRAINIIITVGNIGEVYNIGCDNEHTVIEIAKTILEMTKPGSKLKDWIEYVEDRPFNDFRYSINSNKITKLGWKPKVNFKEGLQHLVELAQFKADLKDF